MTSMFKMIIPAFAALALMLGLSLQAQDKPVDKTAVGTIKGVVKDKDGNAVAGADVQVRSKPARVKAARAQAARRQAADEKPADGQRRRNEPVAKTKTNENGEYSVEVPAGEYVIGSRAMGKGSANQPAKVEAGKTLEVNLTLQQGRRAKDAK